MAEGTLLDAPTTTTGAEETGDADTSLLSAKTGPNADGTSTTDKTPSPDKAASTELKTDASKTDAATSDAKADQTPKAPETYAEFKAPEGITFDPEALDKFDAKAKALNLPQADRDALLSIQVEYAQKQEKVVMDQFEKIKTEWKEETKKMLGADYQKELAVAAKAIDRAFTDPKEAASFRELISMNGFGNHPLMVKFASYFGKAISEDKFVEGRPDSQPRKSNEEVLFDHPTSKQGLVFNS